MVLTHKHRIGIAGRAALAPAPEIPLPLDEMIYTVTSRALASAGLTIDQIDGVCMAASDLNDGRAISTMTLTGSTGSLGKSETRVCNDSLAAVLLGYSEVASGAADAVVVVSWSKLSDSSPAAIAPLALEPAFHRALGFHPDAIVGLRKSRDSGTTTLTEASLLEPYDVAVAMVLVAENHFTRPTAHVVGLGASMGPYLRPGASFLEPVSAAAERALRHADTRPDQVDRIVVAGLHGIETAALASSLGVTVETVVRQAEPWADLGYAAGLCVLGEALDIEGSSTSMVVSAGGAGYANTHAVIVEKS